METAFNNLKVVYGYLPENSIPRPVDYIEEIDAMFYEELRGDNFLNNLERMSEKERRSHLVAAGKILRRIHEIDVNKVDKESNRYNSFLENIMSSINKDSFAEIQKRDPEFYLKLKNVYDIIVAFENNLLSRAKLVISHGDFHPANLIINEAGEIGLVDFNDVTIAPKTRDIGGFS